MSDNLKEIWKLRKPGKRDSARHKERVREAIKKNLRELISEDSIITSDGKKKMRIPMRYLDMWRFKFGKNKKIEGIGQGKGDPGKKIGEIQKKGEKGDRAGDQEGEDIYEEEIDRDEIIDMMLEDLDLPWLEKKEDQVEIETEDIVFQDIAERGLPPNIDRRRTVLENMKRNAKKGKMKIGGFRQEDLRYRVIENVKEYHSNALVVMIMDVSGSMTYERKYIVKAFFFWMVNFLRKKYKNVELVFITHHTTAKQVTEEEFFTSSESGGTMCSSAYQLALDIIKNKYDPKIWNNYVFGFSDGDNWTSDNEICVNLITELLDHCQSVGYGEILVNEFYWGSGGSWTKLHEVLSKDPVLSGNERFTIASISKKEDLFDALKELLRSEDKNG